MDLAIVEWFQSLQNSALDAFFKLITEFGGDLIFLIAGTVLFWLYDKRFGYRFMTLFLFTLGVNDIFKNIIRRPRPFATGAESIGDETYGYAMPSAHASNVGIMAFVLNERFGALKKWVTPALFTVAGLVMLSRIYLGQHYLTDVLAGFALAAAVFYLVRYFEPKVKVSGLVVVSIGLLILFVVMIVFASIYSSAEIEPESFRNLYIAFGSILGLTLGHQVELRYVQYEGRSTWLVQIVKYVIGLLVALILQEGLKRVLPYSNASEIMTVWLDMVRYFLLTLWIALGAFAVFKLLFKHPSA